MHLFKSAGLLLMIAAYTSGSYANGNEFNSRAGEQIYSNVHISNIYSGYYETEEGKTLMFCASFSDTNNQPVVSTCEVSGWDTTPTEYTFKNKIYQLKQFYLTGDKLWVKVKTSWNDPAITKISEKSILSIGTSNGWEFGNF